MCYATLCVNTATKKTHLKITCDPLPMPIGLARNGGIVNSHVLFSMLHYIIDLLPPIYCTINK